MSTNGGTVTVFLGCSIVDIVAKVSAMLDIFNTILESFLYFTISQIDIYLVLDRNRIALGLTDNIGVSYRYK